MKKLYLILIVFISINNLFSQDFSGISICINPGHGGHDGDDRFIEETGFWESEGNLTKGLYLRDILESCGATIIMSRVTNNTNDDLPLSQISQIANDNNVDFFHSIHSNGFDGVRNYPLMLFRGYDNNPIFPDAKAMGHIMWSKLWENGNGWTNSGERNRGDWSYYPSWGTQGLGVLRNLTMPGVLSEGSFHDYPPESWRLKNLDYRKHEAWVFARSFFEYFETDISNFGVVAGIIRDPYSSPKYYYNPNTLDKDAPIQVAKVTLNPGNFQYTTDTLNNGYFFFDSLAPGNYILTFEAENFYKDTMDIVVKANETSFFNHYMQIDTLVNPMVISHTPISTIDDSIALNQTFELVFNYPMNTVSVENAISINPQTDLNYSWDKDSKILTISPESIYNANSHYILTISTSATHLWNVPLIEPYIIDFYTKNRTEFILENTYPKNGMKDVSTLLQFQLYCDAPLDPSSVDENVILYDSDNNIVTITRKEFYDDKGKGFYYFEPENELNLDSDYKLVILENLTDEYGISLNNNYEIKFKTMVNAYESGTVFMDFEDVSTWWDPDGSGSTTGTIDELTTFELSAKHKINGENAGRLNYAFENENNGICRVHNAATPSVGSDQNSTIGFWVFGDLSNNILEYWFYPPSGYSTVYVDTIDWAGWEFKTIPFADINSSGHTRFTSVVVLQTEEGAKKGTLYFDDAQIISSVGLEENDYSKPFISQNHPNPFKYQTSFQYNVPSYSKVQLNIFDTMGKHVATVIDDERVNGNYHYTWDTEGNLKSGIYIYRFEVKSIYGNDINYLQTGKCVIIE